MTKHLLSWNQGAFITKCWSPFTFSNKSLSLSSLTYMYLVRDESSHQWWAEGQLIEEDVMPTEMFKAEEIEIPHNTNTSRAI